MAQPLTPFWPIFPRKSDGQDVVNQKGTVLRNGPTQEQLDRTPNEQGQSDYYRLIEKDEPKHVDWRKKLGGMLLREIGGKQYEDKWTQCILFDFPEGYRLYEHIKSKINGETKAVKNHSGGGHDRQDAYLYGYPKGPKKRFRSPIEFFPHLLWLSIDEDGDHANCACRICSPMQLEAEKAAPAAKVEIKPDPGTTIKKENAPVPIYRNPPVQIPARRTSTGTPTAPSPSVKPATPNTGPLTPHIKAPPRLEPAPLPQFRSADQEIDSRYGKFVARTGEVVWFFRPKTSAWGLGLVARRWLPKDRSSDRAYYIQPLSHPFDSPPQELVTADQYLKPWLAWSAPSCTYPFLQQNPTLSYDQIDWNAALSGQYGEGIADVDASILAAKAIDTTYTLFEKLNSSASNGVEERRWNGIFFGAEKIWNGEPVRLRIGPGTDIMVITEIIERVYPGTATQPNTPLSKVQFVGDVYSYWTVPAPDLNAPPQAPLNSNIPLRMREDIRWRNQLLVPATRTLAYWRLAATQQRVDIEDVKGRWYETSLLFVEFFQKAVKNGEGGNGMWMNARGDATGVGKAAGMQRPSRVAAFGSAVPKTLQLIDNLEPPEEPGKAAPASNEMQGLELGIGGTAAGEGSFLDDFMNFEGAEEAGGMPFGNDFHF